MEIGNDDLDFYEGEVVDRDEQVIKESHDSLPKDNDSTSGGEQDDFLDSLLRSRGIEDRTKIKFENEEGSQEEVDWDSLSNEDKMNIINSTANNPETDLDSSEIQLINAIRKSNMTPEEYVKYLGQNSIEQYIQNSQQPQYSTDKYSDDELFLMDFIARMGDVTDEEAQEALERAKSNETLFAKQIGAIRKEYKSQEDAINNQALYEQEQQAQAQYQQFADSVVDQINDFKEFQGYELNMENEDMQQLYDFITGYDAAGNNHFAKALADPKTLVRTAYLALNGQQMVDDITEYFQKEITNVRRESYEKGKADALKKINKTDVVFKNKTNKSSGYDEYDDLDY